MPMSTLAMPPSTPTAAQVRRSTGWSGAGGLMRINAPRVADDRGQVRAARDGADEVCVGDLGQAQLGGVACEVAGHARAGAGQPVARIHRQQEARSLEA